MIISAKYLKIQTDYIVAVFVVGKKKAIKAPCQIKRFDGNGGICSL